jgi:uncharacterized HAD superfamily protein
MPLKGIRVAIDCDDVCNEYEANLVARLNAECGLSLTPGELTPFPDNWKTILTVRQYKAAWRITTSLEFNAAIELNPYAHQGLSTLKKHSAELLMVTHRPPEATQRTMDWVDAKGIEKYFSEFHLVGGKNGDARDKGEVCRELGAEYLIDDGNHNASNASLHNVRTLLVDRPWNQGFNPKAGYITRISGLHEAVEVILKCRS